MPAFKPPEDWDAVYSAADGYYFGEEPSQIARAALRFYRMFQCPENGLALDLGSGEGRDTAFLAGAGLRVVARDLSAAGLSKTRTLLALQSVDPERVDLARADVREFALMPETYDLALAANVFQFLKPEEAPAYISSLQTATKPGGICGVGVFSPAMQAWGAEIGGCYSATADALLAYFPAGDGWLPLDRTEYWTYRPENCMMASFAYVVARKQPSG